ncbi:MAG TPA: hypothetical protein DEH75_12625 [Bradyrhizobium sp.]|nr:hypothetical protein [Bradyrhizobium sp.]
MTHSAIETICRTERNGIVPFCEGRADLAHQPRAAIMFEDTVLERDQPGHEATEGAPSAPASHEPIITSERPVTAAQW